MKLNEKIYYYRKRAKLSQEELAAQVGVSRQAVSTWELGEPRRSWTSWRLWQRPSE